MGWKVVAPCLWALAAMSVALASGCRPRTGGLPLKVGKRALTIPNDEYQLVVVPFAKVVNDRHNDSTDLPQAFSLRYGITDRLEIFNLTSLAYRVALHSNIQLRFHAGLKSTGQVVTTIYGYSGDPREQPFPEVHAYWGRAGLTARIDVGNDTTLLAAFEIDPYIIPDLDLQETGEVYSGAIVFDRLDWVSLALPVRVTNRVIQRGRNSTKEIVLGGFADLPTPVGMFAVHVHPQVDILVSPRLAYDANRLDVTLGGSFGIDWRWD